MCNLTAVKRNGKEKQMTVTLAASYTLSELFSKGQNSVKAWVGGFIIMIGILALGFAIWHIFRDLTSNEPGHHPKWVKNFMILLFGGLCAFGGFTFVSNFAGDAETNVNQLFDGTGSGADTLKK